MKYIDNQELYNQTCKIEGLGEIRYVSKRSLKKRYRKFNGGYRIIGTIGEGVKKKQGTWDYRDKTSSYYGFEFSELKYQIVGYIEVENSTYLAIVKKSYKRIYEMVGILILIVMIVLGVLALLNKPSGPKLEPGVGKYEVDVKRPVDSDKTKILIPGYGDIKIEEGNQVAYVALWNPDENPCYFAFTIELRDTGEKLYSSDLIPPGYAITKVPLKKKLKKGVYPITIRINTYDLEDYTKSMNGGEVSTRFVILGE